VAREARGTEAPQVVLETDRLILRWLTVDDCAFIYELLNDPSWLRFIGDKGVRTLDDARDYIRKGPLAMYERYGFGLYLTERKSDHIRECGCRLCPPPGLQDPRLCA
jgi:hypothetical protein